MKCVCKCDKFFECFQCASPDEKDASMNLFQSRMKISKLVNSSLSILDN
jgi:hypothetical protein